MNYDTWKSTDTATEDPPAAECERCGETLDRPGACEACAELLAEMRSHRDDASYHRLVARGHRRDAAKTKGALRLLSNAYADLEEAHAALYEARRIVVRERLGEREEAGAMCGALQESIEEAKRAREEEAAE